MGAVPLDKVDGDILTAADINQMNSARAGFFRPLDPTTRDEDDNVEDLGTPSRRWKRLHSNEATFGSTDNVTIGGKTLTQILEDNVIDTNATEQILNNSQVGTTLLSSSFIKQAGDLIIRVLVTGQSTGASLTIALSGGKVESRAYELPWPVGNIRGSSISEFTEWFDVSSVANGANINIDITSDFSVLSSVFVFKNAF